MTDNVFRTAFTAWPESVALHRVIRDGAGAFCDLETVYQNPAAARLSGLPSDGLVGKRLLEVCPAQGASPAWDVYRRVADEGTAVRTEVPYRGEGVDGWFETTTVKVGDDFLAIFGRDITERTRVDREMRLLADVSAALAKSIDYDKTLDTVARLCVPDLADLCALQVLDGSASRAVCVHWDPRQEPLTRKLVEVLQAGFSKESPVGQAFHQGKTILREDFPADVEAARLASSYSSAAHALGVRSVLCTPLVATTGRVLGVLWLAFADTGRRYSEVNIAFAEQIASRAAMAIDNARLCDELHKADRRKDEFLATLAHELRNPLAPMRASAQLLRLMRPADPALQKAGGVIERQIGHMVHLIDDLLDVSRIATGKFELRREQLDLSTVISVAVETSTPLIDARKHRLTITMPSERLYVDGDLTRLSQVMSNLLNNAAKYTRPEGRISVVVEPVESEVVIRVRDTGVGIPKEMLEQVFEMFTQGKHEEDQTRSGLGIGLSLVRSLLGMHGGTVEAHSEGPEQGSEFVVRLPLAERPAEAVSSVAEAEAASERWRILVVDDNPDSAEALTSLLEMMGNEVCTALDGPSALLKLGGFVPDMVLLDIGMPGMSGYDVARTIRKMPALEKTVLVAQTGWGKAEDRRRSQEAGFDHHSTKPLDLSALELLLDTLKRNRAKG